VVLPPGALAETFGIAPGGRHLILAASHRAFALMSSENIPGLEPPRRGPSATRTP
jgi:hypothetical protein